MVVVVVGVEGRVGWGVEAISGDSLEIFFLRLTEPSSMHSPRSRELLWRSGRWLLRYREFAWWGATPTGCPVNG